MAGSTLITPVSRGPGLQLRQPSHAEEPAAGKTKGLGVGKDPTSQYRGVCWNKNRLYWEVSMKATGAGKRSVYLGSFVDDEEGAARMYDRGQIAYLGREAAYLNFPLEGPNFPAQQYSHELDWLEGLGAVDFAALLKAAREQLRAADKDVTAEATLEVAKAWQPSPNPRQHGASDNIPRSWRIPDQEWIGGGGVDAAAAATSPGGDQYIAQLRSMPQAWGMVGPGGLPHAIPQQLLPPQYGTAPGARGAGKKKGGGAYVSHSAAEKQRRDRINSLIDELRGIVPPQGGGQDNSKRPKHAVLSDTIVLLKRLLSEPNNQAALTEWQNGEANGAASPDPSSDLEDGDAKVAISAVPGDGNIHKVKVVCLDQYGEWIRWRMRRAARRGARGGLTPGGSRAAAHPDRGPEVPGPVDPDGLHQHGPRGHRHRRLHGRQQQLQALPGGDRLRHQGGARRRRPRGQAEADRCGVRAAAPGRRSNTVKIENTNRAFKFK